MDQATVECACCFTTVPFVLATYCSSDTVHFFCFNCARQNAILQLSNMDIYFKCMDISGCDSLFTRDQYYRFLETQDLDNLYKVEQQRDKSAITEKLLECPYCEYAFIDADYQFTNTLFCLNIKCLKMTCTVCKVEISCDHNCKIDRDVLEIQEDKLRKEKEEQETSNILVTCSNCNKSIIKDGGCNMIYCSCNNLMCWSCKRDVTEERYNHFFGVREKEMYGCKLYDHAESHNI